ncbi:SPOR domain-containing protein [Rhodoferax sp.]|uniref:SPOR domain-containing protein n=1 Tax=Rhodoferax sp. TaxID=50421 RepID=UPI0025FF2014|nr:SPOR domain-containing protein [Rhodoferax sp.]
MKKQKQSGGTIIGFIVGVVVGLGSALAVAVYVTKVPIPFMSGKTQISGADHDAAETQKNKDWDPNTPLHGKNPVRPVVPAATPEPAPESTAAVPPPAAVPVTPPVSVAAKPVAKPELKPAASAPATSADPLGDLAKAKAKAAPSTVATAAPALAPTAEPFEYFVQAGAFRTTEDAEAQRAKLAMMGMEAKVTEREQSGRTVYRVRMGPYAKRDDAERAKDKLESAGGDTTLVRVQR